MYTHIPGSYFLEINGAPYIISRTICEYDMMRIFDKRIIFVTEIPYSDDWQEVAKIALSKIQATRNKDS